MGEEEKVYSIAALAVERYLAEAGFSIVDRDGFTCDEGSAQLVIECGGRTHLVEARAKRQRGEASKPTESEAKMRRVCMAYVIEHPEVESIQFDIVEALIGEHATVRINANMCAYYWER